MNWLAVLWYRWRLHRELRRQERAGVSTRLQRLRALKEKQ